MTTRWILLLTLTFAGLLTRVTCIAIGAPVEPAEFFEKQVRPVLATHCFQCHGPEKQKSGLRLDSRAAALKGADSGPVVVPGDSAKSSLVKAISYDGEIKMPPKGKLPPDAIAALTQWVQMGAPWPESNKSEAEASAKLSAARKHWAFQPVASPLAPAVNDVKWCRTPIDAFVLAKLEAAGMKPAPPAEKVTLLRRATFDLTGLPPKPVELDAFVADSSPEAFAKVVDRLLASPQYGERWGRYWLDVARYADTKGYVFTEERRYPFAYTYRDYVIRALNEDLPYDRFITEQIAADQLLKAPLAPSKGEGPEARNEDNEDKHALAAMGFLTLGRRFLNNIHDIIDDRLDVICRGTMGLTVTCARCHDHKFDPIPTTDYYALHGIFASSIEPKEEPTLGMPVPPAAKDAYEKELQKFQAEAADFEKKHHDELTARNQQVQGQFNTIKGKIDKLNATHPGAPPRGMVLLDAAAPHNSHVLLRGNPGNLGPEVQRHFISVLASEKPQPFSKGSGRLELAQAIVAKDNPLTARVMVNRIWLYHFGAGLVRTPSNFGLQGAPPSHPELLDYLASRFMAEGWSMKRLHRLIMLSSAYQQNSDGAADYSERDPDNFLIWHVNRRRLDFEAMRDSLLAATGDLELAMGGPSVDLFKPPFARRRAIYGFVDRQNLPGDLRTFDFASPDAHSPQRFSTIVPQQALFLMNSPFVVEQAKRLANRSDVQAIQENEKRIDYLYRILYGRPANSDELALGLRFLEEAGGNESDSKLAPFERYVQVLVLANDFGFVD